MTNRKEVAKLAGVSEATVSRVLNGIGPMKESTRQRVLQAAKQLNYELNAVASSFARGRSGNLGVVLPHVPKVHLFSTYYFSELLEVSGKLFTPAVTGCCCFSGTRPSCMITSPCIGRSAWTPASSSALALSKRKTAVHRLADERLPYCVMDQRFDHPLLNIVAADHEQEAMTRLSI